MFANNRSHNCLIFAQWSSLQYSSILQYNFISEKFDLNKGVSNFELNTKKIEPKFKF